MNKPFFIITLSLLAACSPQNQNTPTQAASNTSQVIASSTASAIHPSSIPVASSTPTQTTADAATQAKQLHDLMQQFEKQAGERVVAMRQKTVQPNLAQSVELIRSEVVAIKQSIEKLKNLSLDGEVAQTRDLLVEKMRLFAEQADLQVAVADLNAQGKASEAMQKMDISMKQAQALEMTQQKADEAYATLLKKHQLAP